MMQLNCRAASGFNKIRMIEGIFARNVELQYFTVYNCNTCNFFLEQNYEKRNATQLYS